MIDKEIIVDGVDVSKCPNLLKEYLPSCYCSTLDKENQEASCAGCFCLFKIKQYMNNNKLIEDLRYELEQKTTEYEKLKEENQRLGMQLCNECGERDDYNIPYRMIRDLDCGLQKEIKENDGYRKALKEIEEYFKTECVSCKEQYYNQHCEDCETQYFLDIISKAKEV